jgi:hypothetical protein
MEKKHGKNDSSEPHSTNKSKKSITAQLFPSRTHTHTQSSAIDQEKIDSLNREMFPFFVGWVGWPAVDWRVFIRASSTLLDIFSDVKSFDSY